MSSTRAVTLCDWTNAKQGGYGRSVTCADGATRTTDPSQSECVAGVSGFQTNCPTLTVANVEDCTNAIGSNLCEITTASACAPVATCLHY